MADYIPTSQKRYSQWRGPTSSDDYNDFVGETYSDIVRLYNLLKDLDERMRAYFAQTVKEDILLRRKIEKLDQDMEDLSAGGAGTLYSRFYSDVDLQNATIEGDIPSEEILSIDTIRGVMTLPQLGEETSNLVFRDSIGTLAAPPSLAFQFNASNPSGSSVSEGNAFYALVPERSMVWERLCVLDDEPGSNAELEVYIKVPLDIVSNINSNCIIMHLFPSYFLDLVDLQYSVDAAPTSNLNELTYAAWPHHFVTQPESMKWVPPAGTVEGEDTSINNAKPLRFDFDPEAITALYFKFRQRNWLKENDIYVVPMGASFISLENRRFRSEGRRVIKFEAPDGESFYSVNEVEFLIYNHPTTALGDIAAYRLFYEPTEGIYQEIDIDQEISFGTDTIYVEVSLYESEGHGTPALTGVKIEYSTS